jgi:protein-disulfide isomerase
VATRTQRKQQLRAEREARERAADQRSTRKRRLALLGGALAAAIVIVAIAIAVSSGGGTKTSAPGGPVSGVSATTELFAGIAEHGTELGSPTAPVTLVEYADLRCPVCREYTLGAFPGLVQRYVRTGKLRMVFRAQTFVGQQFAPGDSERAARFALAAGQQDKLWPFADLFYRNQGDETTSYASDAFLSRLGRAVPGLDDGKALAGRQSKTVDSELSLADSSFNAAGFTGTPSFQLGRSGGRLRTLSAPNLSTGEFTGPIDALLRRQ